ncbi:MAG: class I SAM-dependent methyltransferase [Candidatus Udaeobacter sp.]
MPLIARLKNFLRARTQRWAPAALKKALWDQEYSAGRLDYCEDTRGDAVYPILAAHAVGGSILDLGCGHGNTGSELPAECYAIYTGIDVSEVAIQRARVRAVASGRGGKNSYQQGDILGYVPTQPHDVILFRESLYYFPRCRIAPLIDRLGRALKPRGVFIVTFYSADRYSRIIEELERHLALVERISTASGALILVVRPRAVSIG